MIDEQLNLKLQKYTYKFTRNAEDAEDAVQDAYLNVLKSKADIRNMKNFLYRAVYTAALNVLRTNRKHAHEDEHGIDSMESDFSYRDIMMVNKFYDAINALPETQRKTMLHVLNGGSFAEFPGNYDTNKANWRHASVKVLTACGGQSD